MGRSGEGRRGRRDEEEEEEEGGAIDDDDDEMSSLLWLALSLSPPPFPSPRGRLMARAVVRGGGGD